MHTSLRKRLAAGMLASALVLAGCSSGRTGDGSQAPLPATSAAQAAVSPATHGTITLAYVDWASCVAATNVMAATLEQAGYHVKTVSVTAAMLYEGLASGDVDAMVCAWLPTAHAVYYARTQHRLVNLGPNMTGTKIGLVVPDYVTIDSIADLANKATARKFDERIIGIDPGAGEMAVTRKAIKAYSLPENLIVGSSATMTAALAGAISQHQWIVVTGWTPHWMWARWKLKYLTDPSGIYGGPEDIDTLARKGLKHAMPRAYAILDAFDWTATDMDQVMAADQKPHADPRADARQWVKAHPQTVAGWLAR